jgi:hypothetical protein
MNAIKHHLEQLAPSLHQPITPPSYDEITLTEEEASEALRLGREKKYLQQLKDEWHQKIKSKPVHRQYSAEELFSALKATRSAAGKRYVIDRDNENQVNQLCLYFSKDARFVGDLDKGLLLMGKNGTGKSHLMAFFMQNQNFSYSMVTTRAVENMWINETKEEAGTTIHKYSNLLQISQNSNRFGHTLIGFCFDDLGSESVPSKKYGEEKVVMTEVLLNRYDSKLPFNATHVITNLDADGIDKLYTIRVRERFREMFNMITFEGSSRR